MSESAKKYFAKYQRDRDAALGGDTERDNCSPENIEQDDRAERRQGDKLEHSEKEGK